MYKIFKYGRLGGYGESDLAPQPPVTMSLKTDPLDAYQPTVYISNGVEPVRKVDSIPVIDLDTIIETPDGKTVVEYVPTEEIEEAQGEGGMSPSDLVTWERPMSGDEYQGDADIVQVTESDLEGKSWWNWKSFGIGVGAGAGFLGLIWLFSRGGKKRKR